MPTQSASTTELSDVYSEFGRSGTMLIWDNCPILTFVFVPSIKALNQYTVQRYSQTNQGLNYKTFK